MALRLIAGTTNAAKAERLRALCARPRRRLGQRRLDSRSS